MVCVDCGGALFHGLLSASRQNLVGVNLQEFTGALNGGLADFRQGGVRFLQQVLYGLVLKGWAFFVRISGTILLIFVGVDTCLDGAGLGYFIKVVSKITKRNSNF